VLSRSGLFLPHSTGARWLNRGRLAAAGLCLLLAVVAALGAARTRPPRMGPTVPVVIAARTLPAGRVLHATDLAVRRWPKPLRPSGTSAAAPDLVGKRLAAPVLSGEPITTARLLGRDLAAGLGRRTVAVPISLPAEGGAILRGGDYVDVFAVPVGVDGIEPAAADGSGVSPPQGAQVAAKHALVLAVLPGHPDAATGVATTEVVLALARPVALRIAARGATEQFTAVLEPP
jgi:Flp pilus assembly protein CpaB